MVNEYEIKKQICDIGRRIYSRNMVAANDGNISVKLNDNEFLCTPTGVSKGFMTPEYICKVDREGNVIQANPGFKPSSEIKMHMRVYEKRPDVGSVVHAHPPASIPIVLHKIVSLGLVHGVIAPITPKGPISIRVNPLSPDHAVVVITSVPGVLSATR